MISKSSLRGGGSRRGNPYFGLLRYAVFFATLSYSNAVLAYDPYECLNDVSGVDSEISIGLATELCSGSWSPEPAKCYLGASLVDEEIPRGIAIELCAGSVNAEKTLECYSKSGTKNLNRGLATTLCSAKKNKN